MAHIMDEGQVIAYWEATASEYDATDKRMFFPRRCCLSQPRPRNCTVAPWRLPRKQLGSVLPTWERDPRTLARNKACQGQASHAARAHAGLCGRHHAHHIAHIDLDAADARTGGEATTSKNLRNQACYETGAALNARGRGVQLARKECFTQACRAILPGDAPLPETVVNALHASPP